MLRKLPALDIEGPPIADPGQWRLKVDGMVERPRTYSIQEIRALEPAEATVPFVCVEGWDMWVKWKGVRLRRIIEDVKPLPEACWLTFYSCSEYTDSLFIKDAMDDRTMLAYGYEDGELPAENGGPLRLVVPFKLAYKSVKWLQRISFVGSEEPGYWEKMGYPPEAGIPDGTKMKYGLR
ncbi:MAG TPA: molybdopterin-dependent oxidoreductase [Methanocella sp.]|uniref:molybdopterin-dependent oxidoreductase n=1 Tax=Methanocella sp. TaxID=2052833 RepID=UPI002C77FFBD|nr:molybdopterin-dependent oxidoreductase [Methanocella sp.]HTY90390.1 molybdopterin-dependent oxidoreductase [Methanocella sp.]